MISPPTPSQLPKPRKHLSADALYRLVRAGVEQIPDHRQAGKVTIALPDALMSALAIFALKDPSMLAFDDRRSEHTMQNIFGIQRVPCDTQMREILDPIDPIYLNRLFTDIFSALQRGKALEPYVFHKNCYLLSIDGTQYFSSDKIHCPSCLERHHRGGKTSYSHQALNAVIVHPDLKEVIPVAVEPIIKQDGDNKNDCERNASKRLLRRLRREHPHLKLIVLADSLSSNAPLIRTLQELGMHFILGAKEADHAWLFKQVYAARDEGRAKTINWNDTEGNAHTISFVRDVSLNEANQDLLVHFLEYVVLNPEGNVVRRFSWVTDLDVTKGNAKQLVRGGRARWKIENETFNTLKNQGYNFEHNYGHGYQHLSVILMMLMMLAFLIDQTQQLTCPLFRATWQKLRTKRSLWEKVRFHFWAFTFESMQDLYQAILYDLGRQLPPPRLGTAIRPP